MSDSRTPGYNITRSGRMVYDTGKVMVGIRAGEQQTQRAMRSVSRDAEQLQAALVRYGSADGNAMHPKNWRTLDRLIDSKTEAARERYDRALEGAELVPRAPRRPGVISLGSISWRRVVDAARLYAALALATARGVMR